MSNDSEDWSEFHRAARSRPPRELLRRALGAFAVERRPAGVAVDLGCGSGPDAAHLLQSGWTVHAVDTAAQGLEMLRSAVPAPARARLVTVEARLERYELPPCDLVWSGWSLPYCPAAEWPALVQRIGAALRPGGRFAGDLFGPRHAWAAGFEVTTLEEAALRQQLRDAGLTIEAFDVEDGWRPSGGAMTRWHAYGVIAVASA